MLRLGAVGHLIMTHDFCHVLPSFLSAPLLILSWSFQGRHSGFPGKLSFLAEPAMFFSSAGEKLDRRLCWDEQTLTLTSLLRSCCLLRGG